MRQLLAELYCPVDNSKLAQRVHVAQLIRYFNNGTQPSLENHHMSNQIDIVGLELAGLSRMLVSILIQTPETNSKQKYTSSLKNNNLSITSQQKHNYMATQ